MKFPRQDLADLADLITPGGLLTNNDGVTYELIKNDLVDSSRWSLIYEQVLAVNGRFYRTRFSSGATEIQFEEPYDSIADDLIEVTEVTPVQRLVTVYEPVIP